MYADTAKRSAHVRSANTKVVICYVKQAHLYVPLQLMLSVRQNLDLENVSDLTVFYSVLNLVLCVKYMIWYN